MMLSVIRQPFHALLPLLKGLNYFSAGKLFCVLARGGWNKGVQPLCKQVCQAVSNILFDILNFQKLAQVLNDIAGQCEMGDT